MVGSQVQGYNVWSLMSPDLATTDIKGRSKGFQYSKWKLHFEMLRTVTVTSENNNIQLFLNQCHVFSSVCRHSRRSYTQSLYHSLTLDYQIFLQVPRELISMYLATTVQFVLGIITTFVLVCVRLSPLHFQITFAVTQHHPARRCVGQSHTCTHSWWITCNINTMFLLFTLRLSQQKIKQFSL